jgi:glycosyltransferase involved in cell wall biosynthesis
MLLVYGGNRRFGLILWDACSWAYIIYAEENMHIDSDPSLMDVKISENCGQLLHEAHVEHITSSEQEARRLRSDPPELSLIIPTKNEAAGIAQVIARARRTLDALRISYELIVVDDGSDDETAGIACREGVKVLRHPYNIGNGAAVKTGIRAARGKTLVMLDGDGQHPPEEIPSLLQKLGDYHMVVGARAAGSETSWHRNVANYVYNWMATYVCGIKIRDLTSGFRAMRAHIAREFVNLLPNTFSYPTTITLATVRSGYSLTYVPIQSARRAGNSKSKIRLLRDGTRFFLIILKICTLFSPLKIFFPASAVTFLVGFLYGLFKVFFMDGRYGPSAAMLVTFSVIMFLIGLISEQVAQMRFDHFERIENGHKTCVEALEKQHG